MQASYGCRSAASPPCSREGYRPAVCLTSRSCSFANLTPYPWGRHLYRGCALRASGVVSPSFQDAIAAGLPPAPMLLALGAACNAASGLDVQDRACAAFMWAALSGRLMNFRHMTPPRAKDLVWRIAADAPLGAWLDATSASTATARTVRPEIAPDTWAGSSYDLLHGAEVREISFAVTAELLDELHRHGALRREPLEGSA
jgi:hypothetical protein